MSDAVIPTVHPSDPMYEVNPDLYAEAGQEGRRFCRLATDLAGTDVYSICDFGCLGGRVLRYLKAAWPDASLTAADIHVGATKFCAKTFGARPVVCDTNPDKVELGAHDLIWVGSVMTHVDCALWPAFLRLFERSLTTGGVVVFTAYGLDRERDLRSGTNRLNLTPEAVRLLLEQLDGDGAGYRDTDFGGDCVVRREWAVAQLPETLRLVTYAESAWLGQDVIACVKRPRGR